MNCPECSAEIIPLGHKFVSTNWHCIHVHGKYHVYYYTDRTLVFVNRTLPFLLRFGPGILMTEERIEKLLLLK